MSGPSRPNAGITRWGGLAGVAYVVLFAVGVILLYGSSPDTSGAPPKSAADRS